MWKRILATAVCVSTGAACSSQEAEVSSSSSTEEGPLVERASIEVHERPWALTVGDANRDGHLDVVVGGAAVSVLVGDGKGGLTSAPGPPFDELIEAMDFAFGDFDEDGRTDIAVAEHDSEVARFHLLQGTTGGGFEPTSGSPFAVNATPHLHTIAAMDIDTDGHLDVVTDSWPESRLVLVAGRGDGTFVTPVKQLAVPEVPIQNLRAADMNGDGLVDVVTPAHDSESVTVLLADGRGSFTQAPGSPYASFGGFSTVALGDVDGDGDTDVIEVHRSDQSTQYKEDALSILLNAGDGRLAHASGSPLRGLPDRSNEVAVGDVDGDGRLDAVVLGETDGVVELFLGGAETMRSAGVNAVGGRARGVAVGDLDGDGRAEVLITDWSGGRVIVMGL
jgi:hypothetical protein